MFILEILTKYFEKITKEANFFLCTALLYLAVIFKIISYNHIQFNEYISKNCTIVTWVGIVLLIKIKIHKWVILNYPHSKKFEIQREIEFHINNSLEPTFFSKLNTSSPTY